MIKLNRKLLTLDDLYRFYSTKKKSMKFDSNKSGEPIVVQVEGKMIFEQDENTEGLTAVTLQACHTEKNLNKSSISFETMQNKMLPTFKNRPILGYIHDVDGEPQFYGHNMHIDEDTDELIYDEIAVGIIPESNNARLEYDSKEDRYNVFIDGYIFNDYTKATQILEREQELSVSVEIAVKSMSYDVKTKVLNIDDGYFSGVTILGVDEEGNTIRPGMSGSNIKLKDFSESNNSIFSDMTDEEHSKLIETLERLNTTLSELNINKTQNFSNNEKEGGSESVIKLEELLSKYNKTVDELDFETEGLSDEELEAKFAEAFDDGGEGEGAEGTDNGEGSEENDNTIVNNEEDPEGDPDTEPTGEFTENPENDNSETPKFSKTFELSHEDVRSALYTLLAPYEENDNDWYWIVSVYDDHFVYQGMMGNYWGQKYTTEGDNVAFEGERYELYVEFLTQSEKTQLESMRSNYSSIVEELNKYKEAETNAAKEEILSDEAYAEFIETEEFKSIREKFNEYSVDEIKTVCELAFAKLVKAKGNFSYAENKKKKENKVNKIGINSSFEKNEDEKDPYGDYFKSLSARY